MQSPGQTPLRVPANQPGWLEHWRLSTFSFGRVQKQNNRDFFEVIGTGFLVATDPHTAFIVTAKHVFDDPTKQWHPSELRLRFAWQERSSVYVELGTTLKLLDLNQKPLWLAADNDADIAAMPINIADLHTPVQPHAIGLADIATSDNLFEGGSILVLGYPGIVGNEYLVRAFSRGGIVAWINPEHPFGKPFFIDSNIYPGNSGGPVLSLPTGIDKMGTFNVGGGAKLLGIVSKAPGQNTDLYLQVPGSNLPLRITQNVPLGGTGVIEPAMLIPDLLKKFPAEKP